LRLDEKKKILASINRVIKMILSIKTGTINALNQDLEGGRKPQASRPIGAAN
jgi:hypothetical protein